MAVQSTWEGEADSNSPDFRYLNGIPARELQDEDYNALTAEQREAVAECTELYTPTPAARAIRYGLVSAWNQEDATDSYGANHLANNNGVTFVAGKLTNAGQYVAASLQTLSIPDNASLRVDGVDCWWGYWINHNSLPAGIHFTVCKTNATGSPISSMEYMLGTSSSAGFPFAIKVSDGTTLTALIATGSLPVIGTWNYVFQYHRHGVELGINVDGGVFDLLPYTLGIQNSAVDPPFAIGGRVGAANTDGRIDAVTMGKLPAGTLTPTLVSEIMAWQWNGGVGRQWV